MGYSEDDEYGCYYGGSNVFVAGGIQTHRHRGGPLLGENGLLGITAGLEVGVDDFVVTVAENSTTRRGITVKRDGGDSVWNMFNQAANGDTTFGREGEAPALVITGPTSEYSFGTSGTSVTGTVKDQSFLVHAPTLSLGDEPRRQTCLTAAPTTGEWAKGDIVWNRDPTAGGYAAWVCTTAGTPGTWKTCLPIAP
jgi:hypothetical protein